MKLSKKNLLIALVVVLLAGIAFKCFGAEVALENNQENVVAAHEELPDQVAAHEELPDQDDSLEELLQAMEHEKAAPAETLAE